MSLISFRDDRGFTLMELMVASVVMVIVLGSAVALTSQVQAGYRRQLEDSAGEQEARYALDWIGRYVRGAANNPMAAGTTDCPAAATAVQAIQFDPNGDGENNDLRLMTDSNPADGLFGGSTLTGCTQSNEDVTISIGVDDALTTDIDESKTITFLDNNTGAAIQTRTDTVIDDLQFKFRNSAHAEITTFTAATSLQVWYVETIITIRTRTIDPATGLPATRMLSQEIKIRSRI